MAQRYIPPTGQEFDASGRPLAGGKLNFYLTNTLTRKDTFSDENLTTANANPVVLDSAGRWDNIFLEAGTYRVVLTDANDVTIWDRDPVEGAVGSSGAVAEIDDDYTVTVDDATKVLNVDASSAAVTITLLAAATAGDGFGITIKKADSSTNTVTIDGNGPETIDGATIVTLTAEDQAIALRCDAAEWHVSASYAMADGLVSWRKGADVASATALTLGNDGNYFDITGTTAITSIGTKGVGTVVKLHFDDALTLTHHATDLILPGGTDITTAAGDEAEFIEYATGNWRCTNYSPPRIIRTARQTGSGSETELDFTGIPPWVSQITIMFLGISTDGTSNLAILLGDSGGIETSGYAGSVTNISTGGLSESSNFTASFALTQSNAAAAVWHGSVTLSLLDATNDLWVAEGGLGRSDSAATSNTRGSKTLSDTLTRVRVTTTGGTDAFDTGSVAISYE